jgi:uncharacterized protein YndB with AHSA1/START domain
MDEFGTLPAPETVRLKRLLPGPMERVWDYLTDSDKRGTWLASGHMDLRVGGRLELIFRHSELSAEKSAPERYRQFDKTAVHTGHITRIEPGRLISYTWNEGSGLDSEVTFELFPQDDHVLLTVTHRRLGTRATMTNVAAGWHTHLGILVDRLKGREPRPFWSTLAALEKEYDKLLPQDCTGPATG